MDGHIHKDDLLALILECPRQSTSVDDGLEIGPIVGVSCRIVVVQPDGNSIVNESLVKKEGIFGGVGVCVSVCRLRCTDLRLWEQVTCL